MPNDSKDPRVIVQMSQSLLDRVDEHRFSGRFATRAAAIRELLETALTVKTKDSSHEREH